MARSPRERSNPDSPPTAEIAGLTGLDDDDSNSVRWAFVIAVALHAVLFSLHLPETAVRAEAPKKEPVVVVRSDRFRPPPPTEQQVIPQQLPMKVPIPDPTPDGPELVDPPAEITLTAQLPESDFVDGIPAAPPPSEDEAILRVGGEVEAPVRLYSPPPRYPELARRVRVQGTVIVEAIIDASGAVTSTKVLKALPMGLEQAAVEAVSTWRFEPATLNGRPVPVYYHLTIKFHLN